MAFLCAIIPTTAFGSFNSMMKTFLSALIIVLFPSLVLAASFGPARALQNNEVLRGKFTQVHQLRSPNPPIRSEGRFVIAPQYGVLFFVEKPFPLSIAITSAGGMVQSVAGLPVLKLTAEQSAFTAQIPTLLIEASSNNWRLIEREFSLTHDGSASSWQIYLTPKSDNVRMFKSISARGGQFLDEAEILRPDGLYDFFQIHDVTYSSDELSPMEINEFKKVIYSN